ncbi:acyl-CoA synthetase family protein [Litoribacter populi]|uniref:acyl transferase n=1 Tax=Litoribacter populi TaxID=2598460 RepID=UPI0011816F7A|nr:acyl transferase [Litoribacter populi]
MNYFKSFSADLDQVNEVNFEKVALALFKFQALHNPIYNSYLKYRKVKVGHVNSLEKIPFLPISFFKTQKVVTGPQEDFTSFYSSSGTTGNITSRHFIWSEEAYLENAKRIFEMEYGPLTDFHILALLPAYLEREGSSLVTMADHFIKKSGSPHSGFYLNNQTELMGKLDELRGSSTKVLLLGVTFALLDFAEEMNAFNKMNNLIIMETGGMKGRRREMIREEVHEILTRYFKVNKIHSEYGMTELMSQAYSKGVGKYVLPNTMKVLLRDVNDPLSFSSKRQGGINVIDLANFHSCAFIETQDVGRYDDRGMLEILGRFDNSDIRGCNLMVV